MSKQYKGPVCKGCWQLGNNCGKCEKCLDTKPTTQEQSKYNTIESSIYEEFKPTLAVNNITPLPTAADYQQIAIASKKLYDEFINQGFSKDEALQLTSKIILGAN